MNASPVNCHPEWLSKLLADQLNETQEEQLSFHLEDCEDCRQQLESLASDQANWSQVQNVLKQEVTQADAPAAGPLSTLIPVDAMLLSHVHSIGVEIQTSDFAVDFLEPAPGKDSIGKLNNIEIRSIIGHGGNGIVMKGFQEELNRLVAVKVMAPQLAASAAARTRFAREAQATAAIVHPNVMPILTVHSTGQLPYLVMPYVDCESLQERLDREGSLPLADILRIGHQVASGLAAAHAQGLVHRDVKPANILLERGVDRVMLTDFGLARAVDDGSLTRTGVIAGTPQYMSPEQARGDAVDTRSDIFSLGSVLYAMCTGRAPFRAETTYGILRRVVDETPRPIEPLNSEIPTWLAGYTQQLMSKASDDRRATAVDVADTLTKCLAHVQQPQANALPEQLRRLNVSKQAFSTWRKFAAMVLAGLLMWQGVRLMSSNLGSSNNQSAAQASDTPNAGSSLEPSRSGPDESAPQTTSDDAWDDPITEQLQQLSVESNALLEAINR